MACERQHAHAAAVAVAADFVAAAVEAAYIAALLLSDSVTVLVHITDALAAVAASAWVAVLLRQSMACPRGRGTDGCVIGLQDWQAMLREQRPQLPCQ